MENNNGLKFIQGKNTFWNLEQIMYIAFNKIEDKWVITAETADGYDIDLTEVKDEYNLGDPAMKKTIQNGIEVAMMCIKNNGVANLDDTIEYQTRIARDVFGEEECSKTFE